MSLTASQVAALRDLDEVWGEIRRVIIGATALGFYFDMRWRQTADVDLVVALELDEFPGALDERAGWSRHPRRKHEFVSPRGMKIDLLPAGAQLLASGALTWPSGHVMSLAGMDLAFRHAEAHEVPGGYRAHVAPPAVVAVLKMTSFTDRPAERERDLDDLAHMLDLYVDEDSERRWDEALDCQEFELAPAYLLGLDVGRLVASDDHRQVVERFLDAVGDPESARHARMLRRGPERWRTERDALARRLEAFRAGLAPLEAG